MIDGNISENAERSRHEDANREGTLGEFSAKLRAVARELLIEPAGHVDGKVRIAGLLQTAATIIDNTRPAAAWLRRQPCYQENPIDAREYTASVVVDLLERYAEHCREGKEC